MNHSLKLTNSQIFACNIDKKGRILRFANSIFLFILGALSFTFIQDIFLQIILSYLLFTLAFINLFQSIFKFCIYISISNLRQWSKTELVAQIRSILILVLLSISSASIFIILIYTNRIGV